WSAVAFLASDENTNPTLLWLYNHLHVFEILLLQFELTPFGVEYTSRPLWLGFFEGEDGGFVFLAERLDGTKARLPLCGWDIGWSKVLIEWDSSFPLIAHLSFLRWG